MSEGNDPVVDRITAMVAPLLADLKLDLYDIEFRGGILRITIDTPPGSERGVDLEQIAFVTRMVSRDLDHEDPVPGRYTLEVSSPGLERTLRTPAHFQREVGKTVALRLRDTAGSERRLSGSIVAATGSDVTVRLEDAALTERVVPYDQIDRARTVFVWAAAPKPGKAASGKKGAKRADKPVSTRGAAVAAALAARNPLERGPSDELDPPPLPSANPSSDDISPDPSSQEAS